MPRPVTASLAIGRRTLVAAVSIAAFACALPAAADTLVYDGPAFSPYYGTYTLHDTNPGPTVNVTAYAGAFRMTDTSVAGDPSFMAWCVDIYDDLNTSKSGTGYTLTSGTSFYAGATSYMATDLERLASYVSDNHLLTSNAASAAFQLAAWEIVSDAGGTSAYDIKSGDFSATTGSTYANVLNVANSWLGVVKAGSWAIDQQLSIWKQDVAGSTQNLAVFAPIPEPASSVMLLAGLGLMGYVARRRRKARAGE